MPTGLAIGARTDPLHHLDVVVQKGGDYRDHVGLDDSGADLFRASHTTVDDTLKGQTPLPHFHDILAPALLEDANESFDAAINGENVAYSSRRGSEVGQMVERVNQREDGGAVERSAIVEGGGDVDGSLVHVRDTEIDLPHYGGERVRGRIGCTEVQSMTADLLDNLFW